MKVNRWSPSPSGQTAPKLLSHILVLTVLTRRATVNTVIFTTVEQGKNRKLCYYLWTNTGKEKAKV